MGVDDELVVVLVELSCGCVGAGWYDWGFAVSEIYEAGGCSWVEVIFQYVVEELLTGAIPKVTGISK